MQIPFPDENEQMELDGNSHVGSDVGYFISTYQVFGFLQRCDRHARCALVERRPHRRV